MYNDFNDFQTKNLIANLVERGTIKVLTKEAMGQWFGEGRIIDRKAKWNIIYNTGHIPGDLPEKLKAELLRPIQNFKQNYAQFAIDDPGFQSPIIICYAFDGAVDSDQKEALQQAGRQDLVQLYDWCAAQGIKFLYSPSMMQKAILNRKATAEDMADVNGSEKFLNTFGYAFGGTERIRDVKIGDTDKPHLTIYPITEDQVEKSLQSAAEAKDGSMTVYKQITHNINGRWGIFLEPQGGDKPIIPAISPFYFMQAREAMKEANEGDQLNGDTPVDRKIMHQFKSQTKKFFRYHREGEPTVDNILPSQTMYVLENGPEDPNPKIFRRRGRLPGNLMEDPETDADWQIETQQGIAEGNESMNKVYKLYAYNDGTLFWAKMVRSGQKDQDRPNLTQQQVDFINTYKDKMWNITEKGVKQETYYTFDGPRGEQKKEDFIQKTNKMNELMDFLSELAGKRTPDGQGVYRVPKVHLQAWKYVIIGPRFASPKHVSQDAALGRMRHHDTLNRNWSNVDKSTFVGNRFTNDWVVVANEFDSKRAQNTGTKGAQNAASAVSGSAGMTEHATLEGAVQYIRNLWIGNVDVENFPDAQVIAAAQEALRKANEQFILAQNPQVEVQEEEPGMDLLFGDEQQPNQPNQPNQPQNPEIQQPQVPQNPQNNQPQVVPQNPNERDPNEHLGKTKNGIIKSAKEIISNVLKKNW